MGVSMKLLPELTDLQSFGYTIPELVQMHQGGGAVPARLWSGCHLSEL
jgi:hypothetical protein